METTFELTCKHCGAKQTKFDYPSGAGLVLGSMLPYDRSDSKLGRCLRCKRYLMEVTKVPDPLPPPPVKGFSKVPTE